MDGVEHLRVAFIHPDLGIGGAERLVVDAACELATAGHEVDIYTAHYDASRCFAETTTGAFKVIVAGSWFPRSLFGRCIALCAYIRCVLAAFAVARHSNAATRPYDVVIADQVSAVVPLLRWMTSAKVLFYCHFPDLLLAKRRSALHRAYRAPLDAIEEYTTGRADCVAVNSRFTQGVFAHTFQKLHKRGKVPQVLYPAVAIPDDSALDAAARAWRDELPPSVVDLAKQGPMFLSINRYERKKDIGLALYALAELHDSLGGVKNKTPLPGLVIAGGYDARLAENVEYYEELYALAEELGLEDKVVFLRSFSDQQKSMLLSACSAVLYTPQHEHFGIVPLEAMAWAKAVVACDSGGPKESVVNGRTGLLCEPTSESFANAMAQLMDKRVAVKMGRAAREHVVLNFSRETFGARLHDVLYTMLEEDIGSAASGL